MTTTRSSLSLRYLGWLVFPCLLAGVLWLRWPTFGFDVWNVDEAIHAAAARTILDGGLLYRDAVDQRTPLSYYAVAAVFAVGGENNLAAVRGLIALLIAGTAFLLFCFGRHMRATPAGVAAALLFALLSSSVLFPGDAYAANTEWFAVFFSTAAAAVFIGGQSSPTPRRLLLSGLLLGCAFLSKQPALLDLAAPIAALLYAGWRQASRRTLSFQLLALASGWLTPVLLTLGYFAARDALREGIFYTWTYNLAYYGPDISTAERLGSLLVPFRLLGTAQPWLLVLWVGGALLTLHRLLQRQPTPQEAAANPPLAFLAAWTLAGLGGAASGGRGFDHYSIPFLAPYCMGAGLVLARLLLDAAESGRFWLRRTAAAALLVTVVLGLGAAILPARQRTLPVDPSRRVSAYIREHSSPTDRIFVWGFHPDIYLFADRRPASRFLYASFVTGLIPWSNTAPDRDTAYAIVPGAMESLLHDLTTRPPAYIVDCSAGPNRHWQKYPLQKFPALNDFIRARYIAVESGQFVPQGFRLFQRRPAGEVVQHPDRPVELPSEITSSLKLRVVASALEPIRASAPHGASLALMDGRMEYFAHAPSVIVYRLSPAGGTLQGGFGIRAAAYAADNPAPTDGAEFIIRWRPSTGGESILLQRLLRPRDVPADRGLHYFQLPLPTGSAGEIELVITAGPTENPASDWTFWSDLFLDNTR